MCPSTEENAVGADFHGAAVVVDNELTEGKHRGEDVVDVRWGKGLDALERGGRVRRGNAKEVESFHKKVAQCRNKWRDLEKKLGVFPEKPPCLRKKFPIFLPILGACANRSGLWVKQVAVIASKVGALARGTGFLEREGDDEWRRIAAPWNKWWDERIA